MSDERRTGTYPPYGHILRHLRLELEIGADGQMLASMPVRDDLLDAAGALRFGAMATFVDVAAGMSSHELVRPDWLATTDMKVHSRRPIFASSISALTTTVRHGKRNILSESVVSDAGGEVARAWVTYARLPRRDDTPLVEGRSRAGFRVVYDEPGESERPALDRYLGLRLHPGSLTIEVDHTPRIHNSFGSIQGGVAATLVERTAMMAAERELGVPARVTDLHIYYLGQTRAGPFRVEGTILRVDGDSVTTQVKVLDAGNDDLLLDLGTATAQPATPRPASP